MGRIVAIPFFITVIPNSFWEFYKGSSLNQPPPHTHTHVYCFSVWFDKLLVLIAE